MKHFGFLVLMMVLLAAGPVAAETVSRVAAVVNEDIITTHQLEKALNQQLQQKPLTAAKDVELDRLRKEVLSRLIEEALIQQRIKELGLKVFDDEVDAAIDDVQSQNQLTRAQLENALLSQGMDFDTYRENLRKQILRLKLMNQEVQSQVNVSDREVLEYFRSHIDEYREPPKIKLSGIKFPVLAKAGDAERETVFNGVIRAREMLLAGKEFAEVLKRSEKAYGATGGEMGTYDFGDIAPALKDAVVGLQTGEISEPVEALDAIFLLKVDEYVAGKIRQYNVVKEEIHEILTEQKSDGRFKEWTASLRKGAYIDIRL